MTYPNGTTIEAVRQGTIIRGQVVAYTKSAGAYRIACEGGYIYWVDATQVIGEVL